VFQRFTPLSFGEGPGVRRFKKITFFKGLGNSAFITHHLSSGLINQANRPRLLLYFIRKKEQSSNVYTYLKFINFTQNETP